MEQLIFSSIPVLTNYLISTFTENITIKTIAFSIFIYIYTLIFLTYRCKMKTEADKNGKKPDVDYLKSFQSTIPIYLWIVLVVILHFINSRDSVPISITIVSNLLSGGITLFLVSYLFYYNAVKTSHKQCFPESILSKIIDFLKKILSFFGL